MFVVAPQNRGWILEGVCKDIAEVHPGRSTFFFCDGPIPRARTYFFSHYSLFDRFRRLRAVRNARTVVFFTHPSYPPLESPLGAPVLAEASAIISMSTMFATELRYAGVPGDRVHVLIPGVDPQRFRPHLRGEGAIGFSSEFQERKNPDVLAAIVRAFPDRACRLLGRGWSSWSGFDPLLRQPNFEYVELDVAAYPTFYDSIDVFVSPSSLEGGPIPLLEAMMSNAVPVVTRTGFAQDLIRHGENGFLCGIDAPPSEFADHIHRAGDLDADVRSSVLHVTTAAFSRAVLELL